MRLATFEFERKETWGFVLNHPKENRLWVYEPAKVDAQLQMSATPTNGFAVSMPRFMPNCQWPDNLTEFLALEESGMAVLERLVRFVQVYLEQSDEARMAYCGYPLDEVQLLSPIPRPRLMWGLVQNCPTFIKFNPKRTSTNLFPQGHQRPQGALICQGQYFVHPDIPGPVAYNVELGVIIGKKGRYITIDRAMEYVAGYTVVIDSQINGYHVLVDGECTQNYAIGAKYDWYVDATCSWGGKMADAHCTVGPWLTTKDEIGNVYDLLVYTRKSSMLRDRSHTAALLLSVERTIQWYSSFATLYPGDIIHMGTMGTDGVRCPEELPFNGPEDTVEAEIERVGKVSSPVLNLRQGDWRSSDDITRITSLSPAVRTLMLSGKTDIDVTEWSIHCVRHFFTVFKNYHAVTEREGLKKLLTPRFLAAPNSAIGEDRSVIELPPRTGDIDVALELALVIRKITKGIQAEEADAYILGYIPMISLTDSSFDDHLTEPATLQEKGLSAVYGRWADGFNCVGRLCSCVSDETANCKMCLSVEEIGDACGNTDEYIVAGPQTLQFISTYITLFPGDVITLGGTTVTVHIPHDKLKNGIKISGSIASIGNVSAVLCLSKEEKNDKTYNQLNLSEKLN
jgi:2-keto-4-pentenoate hydratase/2-oxohepta-3-ene-1,7-dioic acid hydratase in catechol pathway